VWQRRCCFVVFVRDQGLTAKRELRVETAGGLIVPRLEADGQVTVDMGVPRFPRRTSPFKGGTGAVEDVLDVDGTKCASPCCRWVIRTPCSSWRTSTRPVATWGPWIEHHRAFRSVNAGYMQVVDRATISPAAYMGTRCGRNARVRNRRVCGGRRRALRRGLLIRPAGAGAQAANSESHGQVMASRCR
jgi:diaminopimelate epimerase